ncbi:hypothetical protein BDI4_100015 [Burkholderia diffusa]|nr:hypothetical protein BDI4_100015 [Burkholderia diffusa]
MVRAVLSIFVRRPHAPRSPVRSRFFFAVGQPVRADGCRHGPDRRRRGRRRDAARAAAARDPACGLRLQPGARRRDRELPHGRDRRRAAAPARGARRLRARRGRRLVGALPVRPTARQHPPGRSRRRSADAVRQHDGACAAPDRHRRARFAARPRSRAARDRLAAGRAARASRGAHARRLPADGRVRCGRRPRGRLQRAARRCRVRARSAARHVRTAGAGGGRRHVGDRGGRRMDRARQRTSVHGACVRAERSAGRVVDRLRAAVRFCRLRLRAPHDSRAGGCAEGSPAPRARAGQLRGHRRARDVVSGAARQWQGAGFTGLRRHADDRRRGDAARAEGADRGGQPARGGGGRAPDAGARERRAAGRRARRGVESRVAGRVDRRMRADRRDRVPCRVDADADHGRRAAARVHACESRQPGADAAGRGRLARCVSIRAATGGAADGCRRNHRHAGDGGAVTSARRRNPCCFPFPGVRAGARRRPLADILNALADAGWRLERFVEPTPLPAMKAVSERLHAELSLAPAFLCIRARR